MIPDLGVSGGALLSDDLVQFGQADRAVVQSFTVALDGLIELPLNLLYLTELTACLREHVHNPDVTSLQVLLEYYTIKKWIGLRCLYFSFGKALDFNSHSFKQWARDVLQFLEKIRLNLKGSGSKFTAIWCPFINDLQNQV